MFEAPLGPAAHYRGRAIFLLVGAGLVMTAHLVDVLQAHGPNWPALAIRTLWAGVLRGALCGGGREAQARVVGGREAAEPPPP